MHLPLTINCVSNIKPSSWSTFKIIGERNVEGKTDGEFKLKYDLLLMDSKKFVVQTFDERKSHKVFSRFDMLDVIKDDIIQIFPSSDKKQSSIGN